MSRVIRPFVKPSALGFDATPRFTKYHGGKQLDIAIFQADVLTLTLTWVQDVDVVLRTTSLRLSL
jgi:hypothetical protein